jgi:hypothetical protein
MDILDEYTSIEQVSEKKDSVSQAISLFACKREAFIYFWARMKGEPFRTMGPQPWGQ